MKTQGNKIIDEGMQLANGKWSKYINGLSEGYKMKHNGQIPPANILATTAIMLENTQKMIRKMDETTRVVNLGNFVDYGFGIITAVMPALVANEIVSVQPLKARTGEIFYLDFLYGNNKGKIKAGDTMLSPFTGMSGDGSYSSENVNGEDLGTLAANSTSATFNLSYYPVTPGTVILSAGDFDLTDKGDGTLEVSSGTVVLKSSQINYQTGAIQIEFTTGPAAEVAVAAGYSFQFGNMDVHGRIPSVDIDLKSTTISTVTRSLAARWLFDAQYELQQTHGIAAEEEISTAMASEVRHGIDREIMNDLLVQALAGSQQFTWTKTAPTGVAYSDHKDSFVDMLITMSNAIFTDTKRAEGNFVIAGMTASSIIESLGTRFVPVTDGVKAGPHVVGTLDGRWKIIKDPFYPENEFVVGYKGDSYLEGGYVYAPYLPLFTTPAVMLEDFVSRKGVRTIYGKKILNPRFYAKGRIAV